MKESLGGVRIEITSRTIVKAILIVIATWLIFTLKDVVLVVLTAIIIASCVELPVKFLIRHGLPRAVSAIVIYAALAGILVGVFYTFVPELLKDTSEFLNSVPKYVDSSTLWNPLGSDTTEQAKVTASSMAQGLAQGRAIVENPSSTLSIQGAIQSIDSALTAVSAGFIRSASTVFGGIISFILIVVLSLYLVVQEDGVEKFLRVVVTEKREDYVVDLWKRMQTKIGLWMQGQMVLALLVGILVYLGLTVLGVRNALLFAVLAAVLETIPLFGPIISSIPAIAASYSDSGTSAALIVTGLYLIIHQFENHLIYPLVVKKIVGIPPILVILALIIGWKLAGFLGLILSVPVASLIVEFIDDMDKKKKTVNV